LTEPAAKASSIDLVEFLPDRERAKNPGGLPETAVVATVNEQPVFVGELLEPYRPALIKAEKQASREELEQMRAEIIQRGLPAAIEQKLFVQGLKTGLKEAQVKALDKHLDQAFESEVQKRMKEVGVTSKREFQLHLQERGVSYDHWRQQFRENQMAREFIFIKGKKKYEPTREELLKYYQEHAADYEYPVKVRWQQIVISDRKRDGDESAKHVLVKVLDALLAGEDFGELAKQYSDGPTAKTGGNWDWTQAGSLADKTVEATLFELPVGEVSPAIPTPLGFQIVRVIERKDAGRTSFGELQDEIKETLVKEDYQQHVKEAVIGIKESAVIRTIFDDPPEETAAASREPAEEL
jgi:parvulin-like peptidyl-prolyl isomerase